MIKIGITGSLGSGKSTVSKLISEKKYPLFSADKAVKEVYKTFIFKKKIKKIFKLKKTINLKFQLKNIIKKNNKNLEKIERIIHPIVRKKMFSFLLNKTKKEKIICEIPLLIESKLMKYFDIIIFVRTRKKLRKKRNIKEKKKEALFEILDKKQIKPEVKIKFCDFVINNNKSLKELKKNVKIINNKI